MKLTNTSVKNATKKAKDYKLSDGGGLYLLCRTTGGKLWQMKYRYGGKEKTLSLGQYPTISLADARQGREDAKKLLAKNIDPMLHKKREKLKAQINSENTLEAIARKWHESLKGQWTPNHAEKVLRRLDADLFPTLGHFPINDILPAELLQTIRKVEARGAIDIARRLLQTTGQIMRYAIAQGSAVRDITADLKGALKTRKKQSMAFLTEDELPEFYENLAKYDGLIITKLAFKLLILTFVRSSELRSAQWEEFDFDKKEWRIPAERMKMKEQHIVPLSKQAIQVLDELKKHTAQWPHLFPSQNKPIKAMSENTLIYSLYRMGYHSRATVHGFRSTASTILNENGFNRDVIERQLAHGERDVVRASYNYAQYLPERHKMMQWWGGFIEKQEKGKVIKTKFRRIA